MAAKVIIQDVTDAGFRDSQFGTPSDWATPDTGYVARLIARATVWAKGRFGSGYDAVSPDTPTFEYLRAAELCWVTSKLWKARAAFVDSNAASSRDALSYADRKQYLDAAAQADDCADANMLLAIGGVSPYLGTGASLVGVETGPYTAPPGNRWPS